MQKKHLPIYGVGPFYGVGIIAVTVLGIVLSALGMIESGKIENTIIVPVFVIAGIMIMLMCTGALFIAHNVWLLFLPFVYWLAMTILLKCSEEKWLRNLYGQEYVEYCRKVNRCIPWFPKK